MNETPDLVLHLTPQRLEYIANVLAQRPYAEVAPVLDDIRAQLAAQAGASGLQAAPGAPRLNGAGAGTPSP